MGVHPHVDESKDTNKILLIGNGGREHAIAWKLSKSPKVRTLK
jgi:shikimate 5-dehydrogenase